MEFLRSFCGLFLEARFSGLFAVFLRSFSGLFAVFLAVFLRSFCGLFAVFLESRSGLFAVFLRSFWKVEAIFLRSFLKVEGKNREMCGLSETPVVAWSNVFLDRAHRAQPGALKGRQVGTGSEIQKAS